MFHKSAKGKSSGVCTVCTIVTVIVGALAVIASLAALTGVYMSHVLPEGLTFGTTTGSLSLVALAINLFLVKKVGECCPCNCSIKK